MKARPDAFVKTSRELGDAYADRFNARLGAVVRRRREALGWSTYKLGKETGVTDQTILNLEQGRCDQGCLTGTLARIAWRLGVPVWVLAAEAESDGPEDEDARG